jgi:ethanolamine permease
MYLGLVFCIAEMGCALPIPAAPNPSPAPRWGRGAASSPALCENVEYVLTPAVVVSFLATYLAAVFRHAAAWLPALLVGGLRPCSWR